MVTIRHITEADAEPFLLLAQTIDQETAFMLREPGERPMTMADQRAQITHLLSRPNHLVLVAEDAGRLVGYLGAVGGAYRITAFDVKRKRGTIGCQARIASCQYLLRLGKARG